MRLAALVGCTLALRWSKDDIVKSLGVKSGVSNVTWVGSITMLQWFEHSKRFCFKETCQAYFRKQNTYSEYLQLRVHWKAE
jgi:hypothetical protein